MIAPRLWAEAFGTFAVVFAGTGAVVVDDLTGGGVTHVGVAATFGLVVMAMIYALGDVSGSHLNPAVTIGLCAAGRIRPSLVPWYVASQAAGAVVASGVVRLLFPGSATLGGTFPSGGAGQSFLLEAVLTLMLMVVILAVSRPVADSRLLAGVAIGGVIGLEAAFAGPISGASMNPARSLGPAVLSLRFESLWIYLLAPVLGAVAAVPLHRRIHPHDAPSVG